MSESDPANQPVDLRKAVLNYRLDHSLTLKELAAEIGGITAATLCNFETGHTVTSRINLLRIERFLKAHGVDV